MRILTGILVISATCSLYPMVPKTNGTYWTKLLNSRLEKTNNEAKKGHNQAQKLRDDYNLLKFHGKLGLVERILKEMPKPHEIGLGWCLCNNASLLQRLVLISQFLQGTLHTRPINTVTSEKPFEYVSFGSGDLLQDYITLKGLVALGYKYINVHLIDPEYQKLGIKNWDVIFSGNAHVLQKFARYLKNESKNIRVLAYTSINHFLRYVKDNRNVKADALMAVDLSVAEFVSNEEANAKNSMGDIELYLRQLVRTILKPKGRAYMLCADWSGSWAGDKTEYLKKAMGPTAFEKNLEKRRH